MAVCLINPHSFLDSIGVNTEKVWVDIEETMVFLFSEEWTTLKLDFDGPDAQRAAKVLVV